MFVWGLKLEKILKIDGAPSVHLVSSVLFAALSVLNRAPVPEKQGGEKKKNTDEDAPLWREADREKRALSKTHGAPWKKAPATSPAVPQSDPSSPLRKRTITATSHFKS